MTVGPQGRLVSTDFRAEEGLEVGSDARPITAGGQRPKVTRAPLLGREKLWRVGTGGKARRALRARSVTVRQPGEPHGRMQDATSLRIVWWRKPSRRGGTARTEHARRQATTCRSNPRVVGVDTRRDADGGEIFEEPYGRRSAQRAGRLRNASSIAERVGARRMVWTSVLTVRPRGTTPRTLRHAWRDRGWSPGKAKRPGTPRYEVVLIRWTPDRHRRGTLEGTPGASALGSSCRSVNLRKGLPDIAAS